MNMILCKYENSICKSNLIFIIFFLLKFRQEGWRLEHEKLNDPTSPVVIKGVVFNEMKGVFVSNFWLFLFFNLTFQLNYIE